MLHKPVLLRFLEAIGNPFLGKSVVLYFRKTGLV